MSEIIERFVGLRSFFERDVWIVLWDMADVLLVAVVLYYVLLILKGTRAMQVGIGIGLVFIAYQLSKRLGLVTLYATLDTFITSLVLIIIVIFQHDIRRALMRFGRGAFLTTARAALESQLIEEVVRASMALSKRRIGALIVFERDALLDDFIEQGTVLEAGVSKELIYSVFIPSLENPLHDGALIIRDGRLWQAGAFLPLARSTRLDPAFGARHRAAIGITEETDAVVVVVSEERGSVGLCFNGNIVPNLDASSLRKVLIRLSYKRPSRKRTGATPLSSSDSGQRKEPPASLSDSQETLVRNPQEKQEQGETGDGKQTLVWKPEEKQGQGAAEKSDGRKPEETPPGGGEDARGPK
jgi:diadenylate cyclase